MGIAIFMTHFFDLNDWNPNEHHGNTAKTGAIFRRMYSFNSTTFVGFLNNVVDGLKHKYKQNIQNKVKKAKPQTKKPQELARELRKYM